MPKATATALETASATATATAKGEGRGRKPTEFVRLGSVVLQRHNSCGATFDAESVASDLVNRYMSEGYSARAVHQTREGAKTEGNVWRVQVAPAGFAYPAASEPHGARISPESAAILKQIASATGQSVDDILAMALRKLVGNEA